METKLSLFEKMLLLGDREFFPVCIYKTKNELKFLKIRFFVLAAVFISVSAVFIYSSQAYTSAFIQLSLSLICIFLFAVLFVNLVTSFLILSNAKKEPQLSDDSKNIKHRKIAMRIYTFIYLLLLILCIPFALISYFSILFTFNPALEESYLGRYEPYPQEEVLKILKEEYRKDFSIISIDDSESWRIIYKVRCDDIPELTFEFEDQSDGFAGWFAFDNFSESILSYAAEKNGFDIGGDNNESLMTDIVLIYDMTDGLEKTAKKLKKTVDAYYEMFDYCKGKLSSHPTYNATCENRSVHFQLYYMDTECFFDTIHLGDKDSYDKTISENMTVDEIAAIIEPYVYPF